MPRPIEAVIFDMDGVLIDSEPIWRRVEKDIFGRVGVALSDDDLVETMGVRIGEVVDRRHEQQPWGGPGPRELEAEIVEAVAETIATEGRLEDGVLEAIEHVAGLGLRLALASSSPMRLIEAVLSLGDLANRFEVVVSAEDEEQGKPDPAVYLSAAHALGVLPERCLAIEDSVAGVGAAKAAGMVCVVLPDPLVPDEAFAEADLIIRSMKEFDQRIWAGTDTIPVSAVGAKLPEAT
jgi:mannitol-1-/sugar-/sorbitol-6-/2-deoxyglucose-6-phosphatase